VFIVASKPSIQTEVGSFVQEKTGSAIDQEGDPNITCHRIDAAKCIASVKDSN
jgi:hypothetical protein